MLALAPCAQPVVHGPRFRHGARPSYSRVAIALYEHVGYAREGVRRNHYRHGDGYIDAVLMAKEVA